MTIRAVYFDLGGVIVRTEYQAPRQHLAERLGIEYEELVRLVFESDASRQASLGSISEDSLWTQITSSLNLPESETASIREAFFAGDVIDHALLGFMRSLHRDHKVGLISNAWSGLRAWIMSRRFEDAFDSMIISAEVGVMKPDARIYQLALATLGVSASESVFIDDFPENVAGAREIGMHAIHFKQTEQTVEELKHLLANQS